MGKFSLEHFRPGGDNKRLAAALVSVGEISVALANRRGGIKFSKPMPEMLILCLREELEETCAPLCNSRGIFSTV